MTSTLMIRVDTLDRFSSEHRVVGYALVAIFMDPSGNQVLCPQSKRVGNYPRPLKEVFRSRPSHLCWKR